MAKLQSALTYFGFDAGPADNQFGPKTKRAAEGYAKALFGPQRTCLRGLDIINVVKAHAWATLQSDDAMNRVQQSHGRLGMVRAYFSRNLPKPNIATPVDHDMCQAHANAHLLGKELTPAMRAATGAAQVRVFRLLAPGPMTMDLRIDRLNLSLDGFDRVYEMSCG